MPVCSIQWTRVWREEGRAIRPPTSACATFIVTLWTRFRLGLVHMQKKSWRTFRTTRIWLLWSRSARLWWEVRSVGWGDGQRSLVIAPVSYTHLTLPTSDLV